MHHPPSVAKVTVTSSSKATTTSPAIGLLQVIRLELLIMLPVQTNSRIQHQHSGSSQMIDNSHRLERPPIVQKRSYGSSASKDRPPSVIKIG